MGKKTSKNKEGLYGLKGPKDNPDPHLAKKLAEEQAKNAGILGVLKQTEGSHIASIFGRDSALGNDAADVLGGLIGNADRRGLRRRRSRPGRHRLGRRRHRRRHHRPR